MIASRDYEELYANNAACAAAAERADALLRKVQKLVDVLELAEREPELKLLRGLKSFRGSLHTAHFGVVPTSFHVARNAKEAARDRALAADLPRGAVPANALHTHWDCRYLVDLAFVSAHAKLRYGSSWQAKNSPHGSPPSSPAAGSAAALLLEPTQPPTWEHLPGLAQLREELQSNRAASKDEKGVPWERDWKPHPRLTAAMIDPPSEERLAEPGVADDPLELSLRLLTMAALQKRATKAWLAAKDAGMLRGGRGGGAGLGGMLRTGSTPMMRTSSQDMNLQHMADQVIAAMEKELHLDAVKCVEVMREHQTSLAVQLKAIGTIARIAAQSGREQERIVNGGALGATVAAMKAHKSSAELQRAGCVLFVNLCRTPLDGRTVGDEPMDLMDMVAHTPGKKLSDELSEVLKTPEADEVDERLIKAAFAAIQPKDSTACPYCKLKEYQESGKTIQYKAGGETCDATWHITGECGAHEVNGKRVSKAASARLNRRKHKEEEAGLAGLRQRDDKITSIIKGVGGSSLSVAKDPKRGWIARHIVDQGGLDAVLSCMETYCVDEQDGESVGVQHCACAALYNLALDAAITPDLEQKGAIQRIIWAMNEFPSSEQIKDEAAEAQARRDAELAAQRAAEAEEEAAARDARRIKDVLDLDDVREEESSGSEDGSQMSPRTAEAEKVALEAAAEAEAAAARAEAQAVARSEMQAYCCAALQNLSAGAAHEKAVRDFGGIGCIVQAMTSHPGSSAIQRHGCNALANLAADPKSKHAIAAAGAGLLAEAARHRFAVRSKTLRLASGMQLGTARQRLRPLLVQREKTRSADERFRKRMAMKSGGGAKGGEEEQEPAPRPAGMNESDVQLLPLGSLQGVAPHDMLRSLDRLSAPAVLVVQSGDAQVEAACARLLALLRYVAEQPTELLTPRGRHVHVRADLGETPSLTPRVQVAPQPSVPLVSVKPR